MLNNVAFFLYLIGAAFAIFGTVVMWIYAFWLLACMEQGSGVYPGTVLLWARQHWQIFGVSILSVLYFYPPVKVRADAFFGC